LELSVIKSLNNKVIHMYEAAAITQADEHNCVFPFRCPCSACHIL
jgi:hypothetical protein